MAKKKVARKPRSLTLSADERRCLAKVLAKARAAKAAKRAARLKAAGRKPLKK